MIVDDMVRQRAAARAEKNYVLADRLRDEIKARGYEVIDTPGGVNLIPVREILPATGCQRSPNSFQFHSKQIEVTCILGGDGFTEGQAYVFTDDFGDAYLHLFPGMWNCAVSKTRFAEL